MSDHSNGVSFKLLSGKICRRELSLFGIFHLECVRCCCLFESRPTLGNNCDSLDLFYSEAVPMMDGVSTKMFMKCLVKQKKVMP